MGPRSLLYDDGIGLLASKHIVCTPWLLCLVMSCFNVAKDVKCVKTVAVKKKKYVS